MGGKFVLRVFHKSACGQAYQNIYKELYVMCSSVFLDDEERFFVPNNKSLLYNVNRRISCCLEFAR